MRYGYGEQQGGYQQRNNNNMMGVYNSMSYRPPYKAFQTNYQNNRPKNDKFNSSSETSSADGQEDKNNGQLMVIKYSYIIILYYF